VKKPFIFIFFFFLFNSLHAQKISVSDSKILKQKEDSLKRLAKNLIVDSLTGARMRNDSLFIRTLVRTLQVKNSFYYPFDSVQGVSKLYAPDSTFRIFSWSLSYDDFYSRQRAAIQYKTPDGSLRLVPLTDYSEFTTAPTDSIRSKDNWIGAVYYNIIKTEYNGKKYYTLFGFDDNSLRSSKKWIDVLTFDNRNLPVFGGNFSFENDTAKRSPQKRFFIEYKKEASTLVNYAPEMNMILVDHLISESQEDDKPYTLIPDGDYEGFEWKNGKWIHINKVFDQKLEDGQAPMPDPILDDKGNRNEEKLQETSEKNRTKKPVGAK
jgi:hypothetical protein